ncbi:MAG: DUF5711 family protein [Lachnospiraceae bacterium]|nr:DUF5711 family protein [Lachnospiraceae bacterium]
MQEEYEVETEEISEETTEADTDRGGLSNGKRALIFVLIALVLAAIMVVLWLFATYDDYEEMSSVGLANEAETKYTDFRENLLSYSRDGAFYTDYSGNLIWNYTYEMDEPHIESCGDRLLIYDRQGTRMIIQSSAGNIGEISTTLPIVDADISASGETAVLMQDGSTGYITVYAQDGSTVASGEVHTANTGYPVAIAISSDGKSMGLSLINLNDGDVKTTLNFYGFGEGGSSQKDNITASYSYSDMVIPDIDFVDDDRLVAFGDAEIVVYTPGDSPKVGAEIFLPNSIISVFHNDSYIGMVYTGSEGNELKVCSLSGVEKYTVPTDTAYTKCEFNKNDEVMLTDGEDISIFTPLGVEKFNYHFNEGFYQMIPWESSRSYVMVEKGAIRRIRLK